MHPTRRCISLGLAAILWATAGPAPGADEPKVPPVAFAGYDWEVKVREHAGPGPNRWSGAPGCVRVDERGHLRLGIVREPAGWSCSEVVIPRSLGYGTYRWVMAGDLATLDPQTVFGLFTYEDDDHEIDFELSRWGKPGNGNCQFVVQPYAPDSIRRFDAGAAQVLTSEFAWSEAAVRFRCWAGEDTAAAPLDEWTYAGPKVPKPGRETVRINFWLLDGRASPEMKAQEVTVRSFHFAPAAAPAAR